MLTLGEKQELYQELAKLSGAGFGIREAAEVIRVNHDASFSAPLQAITAAIAEGKSIGSAFETVGREISSLEVWLISAGETSGRLAPAFQHLADYFELLDHARRRSTRAVIYPFFIIHLGILAAVVPAGILRGDSLGSSLLTVAVLIGVLYLVAGLAAWGARAQWRKAESDPKVDRRIRRLPWVGKARQNLSLARFTLVYHAGLLAGIHLKQVIRAAADASASGAIREAAETLVSRVEAGEPLGPGFLARSEFPRSFAQSYVTGELAGTLDSDLDRWRRQFDSEAVAAVERLSAALPRALYLLMLVVIGFSILRFYAGYFEMLNSLTE